MKKIVFATNNANKLKELRNAVGEKFHILSLADVDIATEIPEDFETLQENAWQKAQFISDKTGLDVFADDTGLEVETLDGCPGVFSARYAGENCTSEDNISKLLGELDGIQNRKAQFRTVIALITDQEPHYFEGVCQGEITTSRTGDNGFGYDPVFQPSGYDVTFANMDMESKNAISHRGKAVKKLIDYLLSTDL